MSAIALDLIDVPPEDPRRVPAPPGLDGLLTGSILELGVLQPVLLSRRGNRYQLEAGRRRVRCARAAGLEEIPALVVDVDPRAAAAAAAATNMVLARMDPVDQWRAVEQLLGLAYTIDAAARALGLSERDARRMALLSRLPEEALAAMAGGNLPDMRALSAIASAPPDVVRAAIAAIGRPEHRDWYSVADRCRQVSIPRALAIFDPDTMAWTEDLFAEPGSPQQWTTADVEGFLARQQAALESLVATGTAAGRRIALTSWSRTQAGAAVPAGWARMWGPGADEALAKSGIESGTAVLYVCVRTDGYHLGKVEALIATPARSAAQDQPVPVPEAGTKQPRPVFTKVGHELLTLARNQAIVDRLRDRAALPPAEDLLRLLVLALGARNVSVQGNPAAEQGYADLVERLMDGDRPRPLSPGLVEAIAAEAVARTIRVGAAPGYNADGTDIALLVARLVGAGAALPRCDTEAMLAAVNGEELRRLAHDAGIPGEKATELRRKLVGQLPDWRPAAFDAPRDPDATGLPGFEGEAEALPEAAE